MDLQIPSNSILDDDQCTASIIGVVGGGTIQQQDDPTGLENNTADALISMNEVSGGGTNSISTAAQTSLLRASHSNGRGLQNTSNIDDQETPDFEINNIKKQALKRGVQRFK